MIRSATVHVHFLEEIPTTGLNYEDRDRVADECWRRMAEALEREHGVVSPLATARHEKARPAKTASLVES